VSLLSATRRAILPKQYQFTDAPKGDVPKAEGEALIALYHATDGPNWTDSTNWLTDPIVNNWFGVTVAGGHVTGINLTLNGLDGEGLSALAPLTSLTTLRLYGNPISGNIGALSTLILLDFLQLGSTNVSSNIGALSTLILLDFLHLGNTNVSGNIGDISTLTLLDCLWLYSTGVSEGAIGTMTEMANCRVYNCGWLQVAVDALIDDLWSHRDAFTDATPELNIGGTNAAPTGTYQDVCAPTTPLEKVYNLTHAQCGGDTFQTWTAIVWNGGSAP